MALTEKQEHFCRCIVSGMTGKDSYITAYNSRGSDQNAYNEASKLLLREDIQARLAVLRKPIEKAVQTNVLTERQRQIDYIRGRIAVCEQKDDEQSLIRWNDMLNKILTLYKETESEQTNENAIVSVDTELLKKLSGAV